MKFAKILNAKLTTEWRTQYFDYDEAKTMLKAFGRKMAAINRSKYDNNDFETQLNTYENDFFDFAQQQLVKANDFFRERCLEAKGKLTELTTNLKEFLEHENERVRRRETRKSSGPSVIAGYDDFKKDEDRPHTSLNMRDFELAFSEFYLGLILLQNYQHLNLTAFRKILKKHDKTLTTNRGAHWREEVVMTSLFGTCKQVDEMLLAVEQEVTDKLECGDRKRAMKRLRVPPLGQPQHSAWTILRIGVWSGCLAILALIIAFLVPWSLCDRNVAGCWQDACTPSNFTDQLAKDVPKFWEITIRVYRGIFLFSLMIILLGINVQGWASNGINHVLIFELDPRDHLSSFHLIEIGIALTTFTSISLVVWLSQFYIDYVFKIDPLAIRYAALAYLLLLIVFLLNPLPIFMYKSRVWLLQVLFRIITAPFYEVRFADFWLADQFTSLVPVFQDVVFVICCCSLRFLPNDVEFTCDRQLFVTTAIIGCLPAWLRFLQCLRRFYDSGKKHPHLTNAGKYATTFFIVLFRSLHLSNDNSSRAITDETTTLFNISTTATTSTPSTSFFFNFSNPFIYCWIVAGAIGTFYTYLWDVRMDWGLLDFNVTGKNRFLRSYIIFQHRWYYYAAIISDLILRLSWTLTIADVRVSAENYITDIFVTSLTLVEMFRRFVWNFFRLENEHVNNTSEFRAIRDIAIKPMHANKMEGYTPQMPRRRSSSSSSEPLLPKNRKIYSESFASTLKKIWRRLITGKNYEKLPSGVYYESCQSQASLVQSRDTTNEAPFSSRATNKNKRHRRLLSNQLDSYQLLESFYASRRSRRTLSFPIKK